MSWSSESLHLMQVQESAGFVTSHTVVALGRCSVTPSHRISPLTLTLVCYWSCWGWCDLCRCFPLHCSRAGPKLSFPQEVQRPHLEPHARAALGERCGCVHKHFTEVFNLGMSCWCFRNICSQLIFCRVTVFFLVFIRIYLT